MNIFNFSKLLHKIASCHDGNMYINNNLVRSITAAPFTWGYSGQTMCYWKT